MSASGVGVAELQGRSVGLPGGVPALLDACDIVHVTGDAESCKTISDICLPILGG